MTNSKGCKTKGVPTDNLQTRCDRDPPKPLVLKTDDAQAIDHMDASLPVDTRVAVLLAKMTNAEKAAQTILFTAWVDNASAYKAAIELYNSTGVGALSGEGCGDAQCTRLAYQNAAQATIINSSRLHIPASFICETLHSADGISTIFPMPCLQFASCASHTGCKQKRPLAVQVLQDRHAPSANHFLRQKVSVSPTPST